MYLPAGQEVGQLPGQPLHVLPGAEAVLRTPEKERLGLDPGQLVEGRAGAAVPPHVLPLLAPVVRSEHLVGDVLGVVQHRVEGGLAGLGVVDDPVQSPGVLLASSSEKTQSEGRGEGRMAGWR